MRQDPSTHRIETRSKPRGLQVTKTCVTCGRTTRLKVAHADRAERMKQFILRGVDG
jgi:hypothetical protein